MRSALFLFCFLFGLVSRGGSAVPDAVGGLIYYENNSDISHSSRRFANVLSSDGTYTQLYNAVLPLAHPPFLLNAPIDGTYVYRKLSDTTAEIVFTPDTGQVDKRTLTYRSDSEGSVVPASGVFGGAFRFASQVLPVANLVNCSNRSFLNPGKSAFTGFVVMGGSESSTFPRAVLVRAVGPGLSVFGLTDFLRNPTLTVTKASDNSSVSANDDWSSENAISISRTSASVGAFPLPASSKDAVAILSLAPGAYIAQVSSADAADTGQALIEVYLLP